MGARCHPQLSADETASAQMNFVTRTSVSDETPEIRLSFVSHKSPP